MKLVLARYLGAALLLAVTAQTVLAQEADLKRVPSVTVATATVTEVVNRIPISGTLEPYREVLVYPQVTGYPIEELMVDIGAKVAKGDTLAQLNTDTLKAQLSQANAEFVRAQAGVRQAQSQITSTKASAAQARSVLERTQQLDRSGNVTQAALDQAVANSQTADAAAASAEDGLEVAKAQVLQAQAQLDIAQLNLDHATIKAPTAGIVSARNAQVGAIATSGADPLFRMIQDGVIEVKADVVETALAQIGIGDPAQVDIPGAGTVQGAVRLVAPTVDATNRLGDVRVSLEGSNALRTGIFAGGWIITDRHEGLTVPTTAILTDAKGDYLLEVQDNTLIRRAITAGLIWNDVREVISGLDDGAVVVARASAFFSDGDKVNPIPQKVVSE
ncbi:efflux RND transporter periplasmic adaptor subunit [uncultured Sulfitobacter sp.]|jgi:HlyD family secretion protein|uniref:efflux RND transporter periplasmic adaptor subunit n=1 Tax=Sulfitobacter sp. SH22 TaxID=3421172 RepID=UPI0025FAF6F4|nr:efflux RND transporter periplasmic adaptor subunit [uncultured Sulfitobacter sp.]